MYFRKIALFVVLAAAIISLGLVLHAGRNNKSIILPLLFFLWVSSPYIAILVGATIIKRSPATYRNMFYCLMLFISAGSVAAYSGVLSPAGAKPAFVFLIVPLISWMLIGLIIPRAISVSRKKQKKGE